MIHYPADYQYDYALASWLTKHSEPPNTDTYIRYCPREECVVKSNNLVNDQLYLVEGNTVRLMRVNLISPATKGDKVCRFISVEKVDPNEKYPILVTNREQAMILIALRYFQEKENEEWRKDAEIVNYYFDDPNEVLNDNEIDDLCERL